METVTTPGPGLYEQVPERDYRRWDAVSQSTLWTFRRSAAHARHAFLHPPEPTAAMELGRAIHTVLLEPGSLERDYIVRPPGIDRRTKEGKAEWSRFLAEANGRTILEDRDAYETLRGVRDSVDDHPTARALLSSPGFTEVSLRWDDDGCPCKSRADRITTYDGWEVVVDVKSTPDASPRGMARSLEAYGAHVQAAFYLDGADAAIESLPRRFFLLAVETVAPYAIAVYEPDSVWLDYGRALYRSYLAQWRKCQETGVWPGYSSAVEVLEAPVWIAERLTAIG
jgi:exodeoxyribonuclease VIII